MKNNIIRYVACTLMCMIATCLYGQDKFDEQLALITTMAPEQAIYQLEQYQIANPQFAAVYYHLAKRNEALLATIHPILNYDYISRVLYNIRVYYGNCIYYAQTSTLKNEDYEGIPKQGKTIEYNDIKHFGQKKLEEIKQIKTYVDELYNDYHHMVKRYGECRIMFADFCELYPSEKQAHLLLQDQDIVLLNQLAMQFDSLYVDIDAFKDALHNYPVKDYQPTFEYKDIVLYRLDGLTHTNFMKSTISLWNYSDFAKQFMKKHNDEYDTYYHAIQHEYRQIDDAIHKVQNGEKASVAINKILTNYINKMDHASYMVPLTQIQQMCADLINCHRQGGLVSNDSIILHEDIEFALNTLYGKHQNKVIAQDQYAVLKSRLTAIELEKYKQVLGADTTISLILQLAQHRLDMADTIYGAISKQFYDAIADVITPFEYYKDPLTDRAIFAHQLPQMGAEIVDLLPVRDVFIVIYADGLFIALDSQLTPIRQFKHQLHLPIKAGYKLTGGNIAIVSPSQIFFIDYHGNLK